MPSAWFFAPYERHDPVPGVRRRVCAMDDFTSAIRADGGGWSEAEVLGNQAIVKVTAAAGTLTTIAADSRFARVPASRLDDPLSALTAGQRTAIRNKVLSLGYTAQEVNTAIPDLAAVTVGDVLRFVTRRRQQPRYDQATDTIVLDGPDQPCKTPEAVDTEV